MTHPELQRQRMVTTQVAARGVVDEAILAAMRSVPRENFVLGSERARAYGDFALPIEEGQTISQPFVVAVMARALELEPEDRVLEVGAGSGYAAAVLSRIVHEVFTVERHVQLATLAAQRMDELGYDNVHVLHGDGTQGWAAHAPFDAISVAAGGAEVPDALLDQLAIGGRLVMPVGSCAWSQQLVRVRHPSAGSYPREWLDRVRFVPLVRGCSGGP